MISIVSIWNRVNDYAKKYQSGLDTVSDFNGKVNETQDELMSKLLPYYETNARVKGMLDSFLVEINASSDPSGLFNKPADFRQMASLRISGVACYPSMMNEVDLLEQIPQRKPNIANKNAYYLTLDKHIKVFPSEVHNCVGYYIHHPKAASLVFTYSQDSVSGEMIQSIDAVNTIDLDWGNEAFNLLVYMVLEKYGISNRENIVTEYAQFGIQVNLASNAGNVQKMQS